MKCLFLYHLKSGRGKIKRHLNYIVEALTQKFTAVDAVETQSGEDTIRRAKNACGVYDVIVFSGGDGTFNNIVTGIAGEKVRPALGYLPTGTVNDLAHNLNIPRNIKKAVKIITDGYLIKHDVGLINGKYFMYVAGVGRFTGVSYRTKQRAKQLVGKLAYVVDGVSDLANGEIINVRIETDGMIMQMQTPLILVVASKNVGGMRFNNYGGLNDGKFDVIITKKDKAKGIVNIAKLFLIGIKKNKVGSYFTFLRASHIRIETDTKQPWCLDGEQGDTGTMEITNIPSHIEIIVPKPNADL